MIRRLSAHALILIILAVPVSAQTQGQDPAPAPADPPSDPAPIRIGPVTIGVSAWLDSLIRAGAESGDVSTLELSRARVGLNGSLTRRIDWNISAELTDEPMLRNASLLIRFSDQLNVRLGQANLPTSIEAGTPTLALDLIGRSRPTSELTPGRDIGVTISNSEPFAGWASYAVNIFKGNGANRADDNSAKDVAGRLVIRPPAAEGLWFVTSGGTGVQPDGRRSFVGFGVQYDVPSFKMTLETLRQSLENAQPARAGIAMVTYRIRPQTPTPYFRMLELLARYFVLSDQRKALRSTAPGEDGLVPDPVTDDSRELRLGVNYWVSRNIRFMWNTVIPNDDREPSRVTHLSRLQVVF
jgi:hypothetical protein